MTTPLTPFLTRHLAIAAFLVLSSIASASPVVLQPQEQAIANDLVSNPNQHRPALILDPVIEAVARARAKDMAVRNYFSHVNPDGVAANYLLRQAGYILPASWPTTPNLNYVESIAAGYADPSSTWTAWMNSPDHKTHLLGLNSFYAGETHYGVGYYYDANSTYQSYWVVITAPPQPLAVTTPEALCSKEIVPSIDVAGTTDPATNPVAVQFRIENAEGASAYQTASGVANWSGSATGFASGTNVIRFQSLGSSGNVIAQTTRKITYIPQGTLTVSLSGSGAVTRGFLGVTSQPLGGTIRVGAAPARGYVFDGWTGDITSWSSTLSFPMQKTVNLQANFIPNPFPAVAAPYYGMLTSGSNAQSGLVSVAVSTGGAFTARVLVDGKSWAFKGQLNAAGYAVVTVPRRGLTPLTFALQADLTGGSGEVTGTVSDGSDSYGFTVDESTFNAKTHAAPQAGRYTMVLAPDASATGTSVPQGNGYAVITISPNGTASIAGRLGDGTSYGATSHVADDGTLPVYCVPSGAPAGSSLTGLLTFQPTTTSDLQGTLTWTKASRARDLEYPAGFSTQLPAVGSLYVRPLPGLHPLAVPAGPATVSFGDGNLEKPLPVPVTVSQTEKITMVTPGSPFVKLAINPVNGAVTGSFVLPSSSLSGSPVIPARNLPRSVGGVVLQKQQAAFGCFVGLNQAGYFSMVQN